MPALIDKSGQRFGKLVVISRAPDKVRSGQLRVRWLCQCDCGNRIEVYTDALTGPEIPSCRCRQRVDITGQKFGRLLVLAKENPESEFCKRFRCLCDCGKEVIKPGRHLRYGMIQSCGCYNSDAKRARRKPKDQVQKTNHLKVLKNGAKNRGHQWELPDEYAIQLFMSPCSYCGLENSNSFQVQCRNNPNFTERLVCNGIDRVDNSIGYTIENSVSCCKHCNYAKRAQSKEDFLKWAERLYLHQQTLRAQSQK